MENAANLGDFETLASGVDVEGLTSSVGELCGDLMAGGHAAVPSDQPAMRSTKPRNPRRHAGLINQQA